MQAIIFDLDGTLMHSSLDFQAIRKDIGCPRDKDILSFIGSLKGQDQSEAQAIVAQHEQCDAAESFALPGAESLLFKLREQGVLTGIVTRNSRTATHRKLQRTQLSVQQVLTREDAAPKPEPDALLKLSQLWQVDPMRCVYVGDYLYDLDAAHNAGMHACLYAPDELPSYAEKADFICRDWHRFIEDLGQFKQVLNG